MKLIKALLSLVAYYLFWPYLLITFVHRFRGVKIQSLRNTIIAHHVMIDPIYPEFVEIEAGAWLTQHSKVIAHFRPTAMQRRLIGPDRVRPVKICAGAFIGVGAIILPGVTIGECAVVGAGSVVTKDVPPFTVFAGNPARLIRKIKDIPLHDLSDLQAGGN
jgi:acetyltransferase-like isoleucine patch superfamily enzyme